MTVPIEQALGTFIEESRDLLQQMEDILLDFENCGISDASLHALFRTAHTIKGSAGLFGLDEVVSFTHAVESVLDRMRNGEIHADNQLISLLLDCRDHIDVLVYCSTSGVAPSQPTHHDDATLLAGLSRYLAPAPVPAAVKADVGPSIPAAAPAPADAEMAADAPWHLSLRFSPDLLRQGMDPLGFLRYLGSVGDITRLDAVLDALPTLDLFDAERCYLGFEIDVCSITTQQDIEAVFEFIRDETTLIITPPPIKSAEYVARINELPDCNARLGEILIDSGALAPPVLEAALAKQNAGNGERRAPSETRTVKVPADRLDALIDLVGEIVIAGAATQLAAGTARQPQLLEATSHLLRLVEDIRDGALRLRMVPIGEVFGRFPRVVRDLSHELGKEIELVITGAETELDKSMVESIADPLMHLVRNAIDHGIESPEQRVAAGKSPRGRIALHAYHESGSVVIEIRDDGSGLDSERILRKAIEKGLVTPNQALSTEDIHRLILEPGFSTAATVTNLSGRGVGMDVVKSSVEALRGTLDIESQLGAGSAMRICLPLTLAIIDGFLVTAGNSSFVLPLDMVFECIELPAAQLAGNSSYLNLRGEVLPFLRLGELFALGGTGTSKRRNVVVVQFAGRKAGLAVDQLLGQLQTVIKPLGRLFARTRGIAGSTILGNGEVALILDVPQLVHMAERLEAHQLQRPEMALLH